MLGGIASDLLPRAVGMGLTAGFAGAGGGIGQVPVGSIGRMLAGIAAGGAFAGGYAAIRIPCMGGTFAIAVKVTCAICPAQAGGRIPNVAFAQVLIAIFAVMIFSVLIIHHISVLTDGLTARNCAFAIAAKYMLFLLKGAVVADVRIQLSIVVIAYMLAIVAARNLTPAIFQGMVSRGITAAVVAQMHSCIAIVQHAVRQFSAADFADMVDLVEGIKAAVMRALIGAALSLTFAVVIEDVLRAIVFVAALALMLLSRGIVDILQVRTFIAVIGHAHAVFIRHTLHYNDSTAVALMLLLRA